MGQQWSYTVQLSIPGLYTTVVDQAELPADAVMEIDVEMFRGINEGVSDETITTWPDDERGDIETSVYPYDAFDTP